jgi:hypothetical protein
MTSIESVGLFRDDRHRYYAKYPDHPLATGLAMPGVTSVIAKVDKSGPLIAWAKGVTADAALGNLDRLTEMVRVDGLSPTKAWLTAHATAESDRAKDLGTRVHILAEQISRGAEPDMDEFEAPFVAAYRRYLADFAPEIKSLENMVWSPEHSYGGTFDFLARINGLMTLGDIKTGKAHYIEARLQLAALGAAQYIGRPNDPKRYRMPKIEQYVILHVRPEAYAKGYQLYRLNLTSADIEAFLGALAIYRWAEQRPNKGDPMQPALIEGAAA